MPCFRHKTSVPRTIMASHLVMLGLAVLLPAGCARWQAEADEGGMPIHEEIVCTASLDGGTLTCDPAQRLAAFEEWRKTGLHRAGSTVTLWQGSGRGQRRRLFSACVPESWGQGVLEAKTAFVAQARTILGGLVGGQAEPASLPPDCLPAGPTAPGSFHLRLLLPEEFPARRPLTAVLEALAEPGQGPDSPRKLLHVAVVCDQSNSTLGKVCTPAAAVARFDTFLASLPAAGSTFDIYRVGSSRDTAARLLAVAVPEDASPGETAAFLLGERGRLERTLGREDGEMGSAIAEAVAVASGELADQTGRRRIELLSDLRQYTPGRWNFERTAPDGERFFAWVEREGLGVDLRGTSVWVCGVHHERGPGAGPFDGRLAGAVKEVWTRTFRLLGAAELELHSTCDEQTTLAKR